MFNVRGAREDGTSKKVQICHMPYNYIRKITSKNLGFGGGRPYYYYYYYYCYDYYYYYYLNGTP